MKQAEQSTYIYDFTGNPFVDAGIAALCALSEKKDPRLIDKNDLNKAIGYISNIYLNWQKLGNLYTRNCILMNPSNKKTRDVKYQTYLQGMLERVSLASTMGSCASCGRREATVHVLRHESPLTGSGDMLNYFSFFDEGFPLCPSCALALQFIPLYLISSQGPINVQNGICVKCREKASAVIEGIYFCKKHLPYTKNSLFLAHSHNLKLMIQLANKALADIKGRTAPDSSVSFYSPFHISDIYECSIKLARHLISIAGSYGKPSPSIRLYSFVNSGQINILDFKDLPSDVFSFIENAHQGGLNRNLKELFDNSSREIYRRLVEGETIALFFIQFKERRILGGWELFERYLMEVENMEKERLEAVKKVGKRLYEYLKNTNFKRLSDIEGADKYGEFRMNLTRIQKETLIWELDDESLLFPQDKEGAIRWKETQTILLAFLYEQMHKDNLKPKEV